MSTLRRAREHIDLAREAVGTFGPSRMTILSAAKVKLASWQNAVITAPSAREMNCAKWLSGAGMLVAAMIEIERFNLTTDPMPLDFHQIIDACRGALDEAEAYALEWEAHALAEDDQPDPVTAHGRIAGLQRTATIRHACGCEGTLTLSGCSEATWREALRTNAAVDCTRCRVEKEQAALSTIERDLRVKALWEN